MKNPLISIICTGRNDQYHADFKYKLEYSVNYILYNFKKNLFLNKIEIIIADWGSDLNLSSVFKFADKSFKRNIKFINIDKDYAKKNSKNINRDFNHDLALDIAFNKSKGKFIMYNTCDQFLDELSIKNLIFYLRQNKVNKNYLMIPRKFIDKSFFEKRPNFKLLDYYCMHINSSSLKFSSKKIHTQGGMGTWLLQKENFLKIGGYTNNKLPMFGWRSRFDNDTLKRSSFYFDRIEGTNLGIQVYKFPYLDQNKISSVRNFNKLNKIYLNSNYEFDKKFYCRLKKYQKFKIRKPSNKNYTEEYTKNSLIKDFINFFYYKNKENIHEIINLKKIFIISKISYLVNEFKINNLLFFIIILIYYNRIYSFIEIGTKKINLFCSIAELTKPFKIHSFYDDESIGAKNKMDKWERIGRYLEYNYTGYYQANQAHKNYLIKEKLSKALLSDKFSNFIFLNDINKKLTNYKNYDFILSVLKKKQDLVSFILTANNKIFIRKLEQSGYEIFYEINNFVILKNKKISSSDYLNYLSSKLDNCKSRLTKYNLYYYLFLLLVKIFNFFRFK